MATGAATTVTATVSICSGKAERKAGEGRSVEFWEFLFPTVKRLHIPKLRVLWLCFLVCFWHLGERKGEIVTARCFVGAVASRSWPVSTVGEIGMEMPSLTFYALLATLQSQEAGLDLQTELKLLASFAPTCAACMHRGTKCFNPEDSWCKYVYCAWVHDNSVYYLPIQSSR
jgi:hypothetical protein